MIGKAYKLYAKSTSGEWKLIGFMYQSRSWMDEEIKKLEGLGLETRVEEYEMDYAEEG